MNEPKPVAAGIEAVFIAQRSSLLAFLRSRDARDPEDLLHEIWMRLPREDAEIRVPLSYLYGMANSLIVDRVRRETQARKRDQAWSEAMVAEPPDTHRTLEAREMASLILAQLTREGPRLARVFQLHRVDGLTQREIAMKVGVSISTIEKDLRQAYRTVTQFLERHDDI